MMTTDNVVSLSAVKTEAAIAAAVADTPVPDFIAPRSIFDMSEAEQDMYLVSLRERRLKYAAHLEEAKKAKANVESITSRHKLERKIAQGELAHERALAALDKLEQKVIEVRALRIQVE